MTAALLYLYTFFARSDKTEKSAAPQEKRGRLMQFFAKPRMVSLLTALIILAESLFVLLLMRESILDKTAAGEVRK